MADRCLSMNILLLSPIDDMCSMFEQLVSLGKLMGILPRYYIMGYRSVPRVMGEYCSKRRNNSGTAGMLSSQHQNSPDTPLMLWASDNLGS